MTETVSKVQLLDFPPLVGGYALTIVYSKSPLRIQGKPETMLYGVHCGAIKTIDCLDKTPSILDYSTLRQSIYDTLDNFPFVNSKRKSVSSWGSFRTKICVRRKFCRSFVRFEF